MATVLGPPRDEATTPAPDTPRRSVTWGDLIAVLAGIALVTAACLVGWALVHRGVKVLVDWPPLLAQWLPHVGPGTAPAIVVAVAVALWGPAVAARMRWGPLLLVTFLGSLAWTLSLALIDGWYRGVAERLATDTEYLAEIPRTPSISRFLVTFADRIPSFRADSLVTHASGHPPLATLIYVVLDRVGLGGGGHAGLFTLVVGASAAVAVAVTLGTLADRDVARRYLPFGVLFPGAVWVGVSADGLFAAVFAWGVALLALGAVRSSHGGALLCLLGGLVLGSSLFLSYGLVAGGLVVVAVAVVTRRFTPLVLGALGAAVVVWAFAEHGFWWFDGYQAVQVRYYQPGEYGLLRPYGYWVWANLAALALTLGPAVFAGVRRLAWRPRATPAALALLVGAAVVAVLAADLSGLSKAEVERIWLPFGVWIVAAAATLPRPAARWWLLGQAALAIVVNSLLLTVW